jgi:hypothetical protein
MSELGQKEMNAEWDPKYTREEGKNPVSFHIGSNDLYPSVSNIAPPRFFDSRPCPICGVPPTISDGTIDSKPICNCRSYIVHYPLKRDVPDLM